MFHSDFLPFRFSAEIRPTDSYYRNEYILPVGAINNYEELIDVAGNFNPSSGIFTVGNNIDDSGTYIFFYGGWKNPGHFGVISISKNEEIIQLNMEDDKENTLKISGMFTLKLQSGDQVKLSNEFEDSIDIRTTRPFTFTGYKI